ncbi:MAG: tryptophan--tRNA ligase [Oscillatoriales cyanobacterium SM2_1_8]|nr:tryptophan--tRNA ligase [Oscillatoriales cyanobacterium SM2_1_8]
MAKKRVLSGVQPTGSLHIGNYLGSIANWVKLQAEYDGFFCVVDLHAVTVPHDPTALAAHTQAVAALYLACGLDPAQSTIFVQSHVSAHSELAWLLNCVTPLTWVERMIQFKEKAIKQGENVGIGLLDYPVLMAADILLYQADVVPVGEDQKQHLELTRDIAIRVNGLYGSEANPIFRVPAPMIRPQGARVMSLTDGRSKMSKSDPADASRINLLDSPEAIAQKIKRCKTDMERTLEFDNPDRPECQNLMGLYELVSGKTRGEILAEAQTWRGWGDFKAVLTEATIAALTPIQARYRELMADPGYLTGVLADGREKAGAIAGQTLHTVRQSLGFWVL